MIEDNVLIGFLLTLIAGLSTGIGSFIAFFTKRSNKTFIAVALGFSAGVMIYISFMELLPDGIDSLSVIHGEKIGTLYALIAFFSGVLFIAIIDKLVPEKENPHEIKAVEEMANMPKKSKTDNNLYRIGIFTAIALAIHNFPEGIVTMLSAMKDLKIAIPITIAVAIHNIPEGISVSVPIYYATGSKKKAFWLSFLSGLAEPLGAIIGYFIIAPFITESTFGIIFAVIAGIMVYIAFDELLPAAEKYGKHHQVIYGLILGMAVIATSFLII
ncbi:MAG: zinc transporter ZupT [Bacteroidales bacterium]|nr:zinc transporter ZupT [Bacteroidales bacterium]